MQKEKNINVLYVDDEINNLEGFKANFRRHYTVFTAASAAEAKTILAAHEIHVLVTDQKMPETSGTQLLEQTVKDHPQQIRILLTTYINSVALLDAHQRSLVFKYVLKPYVPEDLKTMIDTAYEIYILKRTKQSLYKEWMRTREELALLRVKNTAAHLKNTG